MGGLISYFQFGSTVPTSEAYFYALGMILCAALQELIHHRYSYAMMKIAMRVRVAASVLVYKQVRCLASSWRPYAVINAGSIELTSANFAYFRHFV